LNNGPTREISVYFARAIVLQFYGILFNFGFYGVFNLFEDVAEFFFYPVVKSEEKKRNETLIKS